MSGQQGNKNPYVAPELVSEPATKPTKSVVSFLWELIVAVFQFFLLVMMGSVFLMLLLPQDALRPWQWGLSHLLVAVLAFVISLRTLRESLRDG